MKMKENKKRAVRGVLIFTCILSMVTVLMVKQQSLASWVREEDGVRYQKKNGEYAIGFSTIKNKRYYFNEDGYRVTGKFYVESEDAYYYANKKGIVQSGVIETEDTFYITDETGKIQTGFLDYNNNRYYFNQTAELAIGWFEAEDEWYYADDNGVIMTGFITLEGYRYYLREDGTRVSDTVMEIEGVTYVFNQDGSVDENATTMYPVYQYLVKLREENGNLQKMELNSKVQSCAILRAAELEKGFVNLDTDKNTVETLLENRGIKCDGGYEFSYGGMEGYGVEQLLLDMEKDVKLAGALQDPSITETGLGLYEKDDIFYYDVILIKKK